MGDSGLLKMRISGPYALFTRPEFGAEPVSYDVPTRTAIQGIFESVVWHPGMRWNVKWVDVMSRIEFMTIKTNQVKAGFVHGDDVEPYDVTTGRTQRTSLVLRDVDYVAAATISLTEHRGPSDSIRKYEEMFVRRLEKGQVFRTPYLGCREFAAFLSVAPETYEAINESRPLGNMPVDKVFEDGRATFRFAPHMLSQGKVDWRSI